MSPDEWHEKLVAQRRAGVPPVDAELESVGRPPMRKFQPAATRQPDGFDREQLAALTRAVADERVEAFRSEFETFLTAAIGDCLGELRLEAQEKLEKAVTELRQEIAMLKLERSLGRADRDDRGDVVVLPRSAWKRGAA
jgi:hypothetical protein